YVEVDNKFQTVTTATNTFYRTPNRRTGSGEIFINKNSTKEGRYQSTLDNFFPNYQDTNPNKSLMIQITYQADNDKNYIKLDTIVSSLRFIKK
ncbi:MAG: hypothetical protein ACRCXZ_09245, partial [Patescibacteria group bacterium]